MKFCVQKGLGGVALDKQTAGNVECVLTLALLASRVCGYPHALPFSSLWFSISFCQVMICWAVMLHIFNLPK